MLVNITIQYYIEVFAEEFYANSNKGSHKRKHFKHKSYVVEGEGQFRKREFSWEWQMVLCRWGTGEMWKVAGVKCVQDIATLVCVRAKSLLGV